MEILSLGLSERAAEAAFNPAEVLSSDGHNLHHEDIQIDEDEEDEQEMMRLDWDEKREPLPSKLVYVFSESQVERVMAGFEIGAGPDIQGLWFAWSSGAEESPARRKVVQQEEEGI